MNWRKAQWKDTGYKKAKLEGYRSRAAYKLLEINRKFKLIDASSTVLDLGCAPGGWLQVLKSLGVVKLVGIDLQKVDELEGVQLGQVDFTDHASVEEFLAKISFDKFDVILSDMSPNISGCHERDHYESVRLVMAAYQFAQARLNQSGKLVCKLFDGSETRFVLQEFKKQMQVKLYKPESSRPESREVYLVGIR